MTTRARIGAHLVSLALIVSALVLLQGEAQASCALPGQPSAHSFVGTVVSVENAGRTAIVRTKPGTHVVVLGGSGAAGNGVTSVERRYAVGARYEFHPTNSATPFVDNACTATRLLSGPQPAALNSNDRWPGWFPIDEDAGVVGYSLVVLLALGAVTGSVAAIAVVRRFRAPVPVVPLEGSGS